VDIALLVIRSLHYTAAMLLFGTATFERWIAPAALSDRHFPKLRPLALASAWVLLASAIVWLGLEAGSMGDGWADTVNPPVIWLVLTATEFGHAWIVTLVVAVLALLASLVLRSGRWTLLAVLAAIALVLLGFIGHAAAQTGPLGDLARASQAVHLLSAGFWLGSLPSVLLCLSRLRRPAFQAEAEHALRRFSGVGHAAVALVLASGVVNSWVILQGQPFDPGAPYVLVLAFKVVLVLTMVGLALINRYVFMPRTANNGPGIRQLHNGTIAEIVIGAVVIIVASWLGMLPPG
jgi:putative copper resistance protein D